MKFIRRQKESNIQDVYNRHRDKDKQTNRQTDNIKQYQPNQNMLNHLESIFSIESKIFMLHLVHINTTLNEFKIIWSSGGLSAFLRRACSDSR